MDQAPIPDPISAAPSPSNADGKRPRASSQSLLSGGPTLSSPPITSHFSAKRPRPGVGLKLRCTQRAGAITDVTGDTERCKEMLLKPLGFGWERSHKVWRWDGEGDDAQDPTKELLARAAHDGVEVVHVTYRPAVAHNSARAIFASLMSNIDSPVEARPTTAVVALPTLAQTSAATAALALAAPRTDSYFDDDCLPDEAFLSLPDGAMAPPPPSMMATPMPPPVPPSQVSTGKWDRSATVPSAPMLSAILPAAVPAASQGSTMVSMCEASGAVMAVRPEQPASPHWSEGGWVAPEDDWLLPDEVLASLPDPTPSATASL